MLILSQQKLHYIENYNPHLKTYPFHYNCELMIESYEILGLGSQ